MSGAERMGWELGRLALARRRRAAVLREVGVLRRLLAEQHRVAVVVRSTTQASAKEHLARIIAMETQGPERR